jgi:serine/threonine protein kinase
LTDFGLSRENNFALSFCGSPAYLSPEMLEKKGVGPETDIYGIGCVLYEMLIGEPPYFDEDI